MSHLSALNKHQIIAKINDGSFVLSDLSIDRCPKLETGKVLREALKQVYARMVEEVFKSFHLDKAQSMICFRKCVKTLVHGEPLQATSLSEYKGWKKVKKHLQTAIEPQSQFGHPPCIPAPHLVSAIAVLTIRRLRINTDRFAEDNQSFTRLFGHCRMFQWLPIAIKFCEQMHNEPFLLRTVQGINEPELISQSQDDNDVWVVLTSGPSPSGPRALPAQIVERIKELATTIDHDITMGRNEIAATDSNGSSKDEPIDVVMVTTRAEALQSAAEVLGKLGQPGVFQWFLKPELDMWLSEPNIRVMPRHIKNALSFWCKDYSPSWCELIRSCLNDDQETWIQEREVPTASNLYILKGGGSDFLRLYSQFANEAFELKSSNPAEARRLVDRVCKFIKLFAANEKLVRVRRPRDDVAWEAKYCFEMAHTIGQQENHPHANKADIAELWSLHAQTGNVPDCLRRIALANCTPEEVQELEATLGSNSEDLLLGSNPGEAHRLMCRRHDRLNLSSLHYEYGVQAENRLKIEGDVARIATAVEQITTPLHNSKTDVRFGLSVSSSWEM
ncbi:hypothetical protein FDENT_4576 [Fusarium denticulatum]|uniref:Uncharacterized protein n=1 Tax=Fusarium denticulatum TaxID=48507 RepID=A0A8H5XBE2_9HYPO|nr:hypothetical protein FDENT_4576 [Fusarium denticulatum]